MKTELHTKAIDVGPDVYINLSAVRPVRKQANISFAHLVRNFTGIVPCESYT